MKKKQLRNQSFSNYNTYIKVPTRDNKKIIVLENKRSS